MKKSILTLSALLLLVVSSFAQSASAVLDKCLGAVVTVAVYQTEPYVVAADVYGEPPHVGRGGWTWYTGSAGWMYRAGLEWLLGFHLEGNRLRLAPCIPSHWPGFEIAFKYRSSRYEIRVENPGSVARGMAYAELDDQRLANGTTAIALVNDGQTHRVRMILGDHPT